MKFFTLFTLLLIAGLVITDAADDIDNDIIDDPGNDEDDNGDENGDYVSDVINDDSVEEPKLHVEEPAPVERPHYVRPKPKGNVFFAEPFDNVEMFKRRWVLSQATKDGAEEDVAKYDGKWDVEEPSDSPIIGDLGLVLKSKARHAAISAKLDKPYEFKGKPFIVQYEVRFKNELTCGGAYIKLLTKEDSSNLKNFHDKSGYTVMFGPDKCGQDNKMHFIFRHRHPKTDEFEEKHAKKTTTKLDTYFTDKKTHLYTLIIYPDNTYEVQLDNQQINQGSLLTDVEPAVNPAEEVDDPEDKKPDNWDDKTKIPDVDATKPEDWDEDEPEKIPDESAVKPEDWLETEPELIADPDAEKPSDWDDEMDGEWEAPLITNPKCQGISGCGEWKAPMIKNSNYKGTWKTPMIDNPNYQGVWKPRRIVNPDYFEDLQPYKMTTIGAVGLELWSMTDEIVFDNFLITDDKEVADAWRKDTFEVKQIQERASKTSGKSVVDAIVDMTNERPWLWAVFIVLVVLPIVLIIVYCCFTGNKEEYDRKKTDEPTPDDEQAQQEADAAAAAEESKSENEVVGEAGDAQSENKSKKSKSQLDAEQQEEVKTDPTGSPDEGEAVTEDAITDPAETPADGNQDTANASPKQSPRRRKPRKE